MKRKQQPTLLAQVMSGGGQGGLNADKEPATHNKGDFVHVQSFRPQPKKGGHAGGKTDLWGNVIET